MSEARRPYPQPPPAWCRTIIAAAFGSGWPDSWTVHDRSEAEAEAWSTALVHVHGFVMESSRPGMASCINKTTRQRAFVHSILAPQYGEPTALAKLPDFDIAVAGRA